MSVRPTDEVRRGLSAVKESRPAQKMISHLYTNTLKAAPPTHTSRAVPLFARLPRLDPVRTINLRLLFSCSYLLSPPFFVRFGLGFLCANYHHRRVYIGKKKRKRKEKKKKKKE